MDTGQKNRNAKYSIEKNEKKQNKQNLQNKSDIGTDDNATGFKKKIHVCA